MIMRYCQGTFLALAFEAILLHLELHPSINAPFQDSETPLSTRDTHTRSVSEILREKTYIGGQKLRLNF